MEERLVLEEGAAVFFKEQLAKAMEHQKISTSAFTEYYLVNLLTECVHADPFPSEPGYDEMPLALLYAQALQATHHQRARLLRATGDTALFVSGFFSDSLGRGLVDLAYYRAMGGHAYARLSRDETCRAIGCEVFSELAARFVAFADLLAEISEASRLTSQASVLRLYERWAQTGSPRAAALLAQQGIVPVRPGSERPQ
jgi:hypothetical protein